jgi:hypothetical protein
MPSNRHKASRASQHYPDRARPADCDTTLSRGASGSCKDKLMADGNGINTTSAAVFIEYSEMAL